MMRRFTSVLKVRKALLALSLLLMTAVGAQAQSRRGADIVSDRLIDIKVSEITLEAIDFRDQTAHLNLGLDVSNRLLPVRLKDFEYRLSLFDQQTIEGRYDGTMKVGGRSASRINLPVVVNLRSIPGVMWSAFSNRGQVSYELDTGFTLPLYVFEKRVDKSFSGEVPLRSLVDAASILRARGMGHGLPDGVGRWPF